MKKVFTLMLTLLFAVAISANAQMKEATVKTLAKKAPAQVTATTMLKSAMKATKNHDYKASLQKMEKAQKGKVTKFGKPSKALKAVKKAEGDVVEYEIDPSSVSVSYFTSGGDWYIRMYDEDGGITYLDVINNNPDDWAGEYTEDDWCEGYNYYCDPDYNYDNFTTINVTLAGSPSKNYEITATCVGESGTTYKYHAKQDSFIEPTETKDVAATCDAFYMDEDGYTYYQLTGDDGAQYQVAIPGVTGDYDTGDLSELAESIVRMDGDDYAQFNNGSVSVEATSDYVLNCTAEFVMSDAVQYNLTWAYQLEPQDSKTVTVTNAKPDYSYFSWFGLYWVDGSNDDYSLVEATVIPYNEEVYYDYTADMDLDESTLAFTLTDNDGNEVTNLILTAGHQSYDEEVGRPVITGKFLGKDLVEYTVDMSFVMPEEQGTKTATLENLAFNNLLSSSMYQIYGYTEDGTQYASMAVYSDEVAGDFEWDDLYTDYCYYVENADQEDYNMVEFLKGSASAEMDEDGCITMTTHLFGEDGYWYDLTITSKYDKAHKEYDNEEEGIDVEFTSEDVDTMFYDAENGYAYYRLMNAERSDCFAMLIYSDEGDDCSLAPEGTYEVNETYASGSVQPGEIYGYSVYPTFYSTVDEDGYINTPCWFLTEGTVTITKTDDTHFSFAVNGINSYDMPFIVTYNGAGAGIETVNAENTSASVRKMAANNQIVITKNGKKFNVAGQIVK